MLWWIIDIVALRCMLMLMLLLLVISLCCFFLFLVTQLACFVRAEASSLFCACPTRETTIGIQYEKARTKSGYELKRHAQNQVMSLKHAQHAQKSGTHKSGFSLLFVFCHLPGLLSFSCFQLPGKLVILSLFWER